MSTHSVKNRLYNKRHGDTNGTRSDIQFRILSSASCACELASVNMKLDKRSASAHHTYLKRRVHSCLNWDETDIIITKQRVQYLTTTGCL